MDLLCRTATQMIRVKVQGVEEVICSGWDDVTDLGKLLECKNFRDELKLLSTIDRQLIDAADDEQLFPLYVTISFLEDPTTYPPCKALEIQLDTYDRLEQCKLAVNEGRLYQKAIKAAQIYYPQERNVGQLVGLGVDIIQQLAIFLASYTEVLRYRPTPQEQNAGINELAEMGTWGTVYVMAGKDLAKMKTILDQPAIQVYTAMVYNAKSAEYQKRLAEAKVKPGK